MAKEKNSKAAKRMIFFEGIPQNEGRNEGAVLFEFLTMSDPGQVEGEDITNKKDLIAALSDAKRLKAFSFVHISAHGDEDGVGLILPRGVLRPDDVPQGCLRGKCLTLSACQTGKAEFVKQFVERTEADIAIGPSRDVAHAEAAMFFAYFYFLVLHSGMKPYGAFNKARDDLGRRVRGGFSYWKREQA
jgi:hypothetical protein